MHPLLSRQERGPARQDSIMVPCNVVEGHAARRAPMREHTTARQVSERRTLPLGLAQSAWLATVWEQRVALRGELAHINADHRSWLPAHGGEV